MFLLLTYTDRQIKLAPLMLTEQGKRYMKALEINSIYEKGKTRARQIVNESE